MKHTPTDIKKAIDGAKTLAFNGLTALNNGTLYTAKHELECAIQQIDYILNEQTAEQQLLVYAFMCWLKQIEINSMKKDEFNKTYAYLSKVKW